MRQIAFILALTLLVGSVKGSPLVQVVKTSIGFGQCCHVDADTTSTSCHEDTDESESCCGDMNCECTCCLHILICTAMSDLKFAKDSFGEDSHTYSWDYHRDYLASIFHPPLLA